MRLERLLAVVGSLFAIALVWQPVPLARAIAPAPQPQVLGYKTVAGAPDPNAVFALVNAERAAQGLGPLVRNPSLTTLAQARANDMHVNSYYSHLSPSGKYFYDIARERGADIGYGCENLDLQMTTTPERYVSDWMNSTAHRHCLLNDRTTAAGYAVTTIDVGTASNPEAVAYIVVAIHAEL